MAIKYKQINRKLLKFIKSSKILEDLTNYNNMYNGMFYGIMEYHIDKKSHHTFGKILCDNFLESYKEGKENPAEKIIIERLYKDTEDLEKENPSETLKRLEKTYST